MRLLPLPTAEQLLPQPVPLRPALAMARVADEGFAPVPPISPCVVTDIADPDLDAPAPNPLVAPSFREALLPVAEHAGAA